MRINSIIFSPKLSLSKKGVTSGGSRQFFFFRRELPYNIQLKALMVKYSYSSGRNNTGKIVIRTKRTRKFNFSKPRINYTYRNLSLSFIAGFVMIPKINKLLSLIILSSGSITYSITSTNHELFKLTRLNSILSQK